MYAYVHVYLCMYMCTYISMHVYLCMYVCTYISMCMCIYVCICALIYAHVYVYSHVCAADSLCRVVETNTTLRSNTHAVLRPFSHVWLCDPVDCSPPGSSVHEILQARTLEWAVISFSRGSSRPRDRTCVSLASCIAGRFFTLAQPGKPKNTPVRNEPKLQGTAQGEPRIMRKILPRFILEAVMRSWCRWTILLRVKYSEIYCEKRLYRKHIPVCSY